MKKKEVPALLRKLGIPWAYDHFAEGRSPMPPFLVYRYPKADNFAADGGAYFKIDVLHVELYTDKKNPSLEERIEDAFDKQCLFYSKSEVWIPSERLYEVLYEMEVENG